MKRKTLLTIILTLVFNSLFLLNNSYSQWEQVKNGLYGGNVLSLATTGSRIYAGTYLAGLYYSDDNGNSWSRTYNNNQTIYSIAANGSYVFTGTSNNGVLLSTNNGYSWNNTSLAGVSVKSLLISTPYVFAGTSSNGI